jgi:hypothetical protein
MKNALLIHSFSWLLVLIIPLLLIIGSITILTNPIYLSFEYAKPGFPLDPFGFTSQERLEHASDNLRYIRQRFRIVLSAAKPSRTAAVQFAGDQPYGRRSISIPSDLECRKILLVLALFLTTALTWREENRSCSSQCSARRHILCRPHYDVGLLAVLSWKRLVTIFHQFFFQPGTWTFETTDTLIRLFRCRSCLTGANVSGLTLSADSCCVLEVLHEMGSRNCRIQV